jgi:multicomponent K+:H+ antiporter subunit A
VNTNLALPFILLIPLLSALLPAISRRLEKAAAWCATAAAAASLLLLLLLTPQVFQGEAMRLRWPWLPQLGLNLSFRLDGLGLLFALLILSIGLLERVWKLSNLLIFNRGVNSRIILSY